MYVIRTEPLTAGSRSFAVRPHTAHTGRKGRLVHARLPLDLSGHNFRLAVCRLNVYSFQPMGILWKETLKRYRDDSG